MIKELISLGKFAKKSSVFAGGVLFGSLGLKLLASKDAKHVYAKAVAEEKNAQLVVETSEK